AASAGPLGVGRRGVGAGLLHVPHPPVGGPRMSYYARVFCTADAVPTIRTLLTWLREGAGYPAEAPGQRPRALDSPPGKPFDLGYHPDKEPILVECQRNTGKRSLCGRIVQEELGTLEDLPASDAKDRVAGCLTRTTFIVCCDVYGDYDHEEVVHFGAFLD